MKMTKGYYSLVQYCPDMSRYEAANVGIVLFVPEINFIKAKMSSDNGKVRRFFGQTNFDNDWLREAKEAFERRFEIDRDKFKELDDLRQFVETRANELVMTIPHAVRVIDPEKDFDSLYAEMVGGRAKPHKEKVVIKRLDDAFKTPRFVGKVKIDYRYKVSVPKLGTSIDVPYTYRNGRINLVKPQEFSTEPIKIGAYLATEGRFIQKNPSDGEVKLIVVSKLGRKVSRPEEIRQSLKEVFRANEVELIWDEDIGDFIKRVAVEVL